MIYDAKSILLNKRSEYKKLKEEKAGVKSNFIYSSLYQILILILPLVTAPYISRIIGVEGNGIYSYTSSVVQYFIIFSMLGLSNYGNRTIAKCRDDKEKLSKEFSSIYIMQLCTSAIMIIMYILYITFFDNKYYIYSLIQLIYLISTCFDVTWFFYGMEKFKLTVTRNTIVRICTVILIFLFVKDSNGLVTYMLLMVLSSLIGQLLLIPFLRKEVKFVKPSIRDVTKHIKPNLILFIPVIAVSVYKMMDKIMLGNMADIKEVGYYEYAERIINIPLGIITALGTVMLPRVSNLLAKGREKEVENYIEKSIEYMMFLAMPICLGLIVVAPELIPIYLGKEYQMTGTIIQYLAVTIIFVSWANVIRTQYLIPKEKDRVYIISVVTGAIVNFVINIILIPQYQAIGAAIGTIFAEFLVMAIQTIAVSKELNIKKYLMYAIKSLIAAFIMSIVIIGLEKIINNKYIVILLQILIGMVVYFALSYKFIKKYIYLIPGINKFIKKEKIKE